MENYSQQDASTIAFKGLLEKLAKECLLFEIPNHVDPYAEL